MVANSKSERIYISIVAIGSVVGLTTMMMFLVRLSC